MKLQRDDTQLEAEVPVELPVDDPATGRYFNVREVMQGLHTWTNPDNGFTVVRLHYSADPAKRSDEWKRAARRGLTWAEWMREYEIVSSSFEGIPVYGDDFSRAFHVSKEPLEWNLRYPVLRGWDFGLGAGGMACVFAQFIKRRMFIFRELTAGDTDIEHFAPEVARLSHEWFPDCVKFFDIVDPTGFNRSQINKKSCAGIIKDTMGIAPTPGIASKVLRRRAVSKLLQGNVKGLPCLYIDGTEDRCTMVIGGFEGGYHYAKAKDGQTKEDPEKNEYSHPHDSVQMIACRADTLPLEAPQTPVFGQPSYNFGITMPQGEVRNGTYAR